MICQLLPSWWISWKQTPPPEKKKTFNEIFRAYVVIHSETSVTTHLPSNLCFRKSNSAFCIISVTCKDDESAVIKGCTSVTVIIWHRLPVLSAGAEEMECWVGKVNWSTLEWQVHSPESFQLSLVRFGCPTVFPCFLVFFVNKLKWRKTNISLPLLQEFLPVELNCSLLLIDTQGLRAEGDVIQICTCDRAVKGCWDALRCSAFTPRF